MRSLRLIKFTLFCLTLVLLFFNGPLKTYGQAPNISYPTPFAFPVNKPVTPVSPQNIGGAVPPNIYGKETTFAGGSGAGYINGPGATAEFSGLYQIAVDNQGNFFVADQLNYAIRKITPSGLVSTYAGSGIQGSVDGSAASARFQAPSGVAVDKNENIYVADYFKVRKIDPAGNVTTLAGSGSSGFQDGQGTSASFANALNLVVDNNGNIYVADLYNYAIRKITPSGLVTTLAGNGTRTGVDGQGVSASFVAPYAVAVDLNGNVYVADLVSIRKITPAGLVTTVAGNGVQGYADGPAATAEFFGADALTIDPLGVIYVAEGGVTNSRIRKVENGIVSTLSLTDGTGYYYTYVGSPWGIVLDGKGNLLYTSPDFNWVRNVSLTGYTIDKPLPAGLTFNPTTGTISGTPTALSPAANYTITAYNTSGSSSTVVNIQVNGIVPVVTTSTVTGTIVGCQGSPSANPNIAQFTVAGTSLSGDITITPPPGFDISFIAFGNFSPSLVLKQAGGSVISTTIYVRSSASATGNISGNVTITTPGATASTVAVTGTVNPLPTINPVPNQTVNTGAATTPVIFAGNGDSYTWTNNNPAIGLPASGTGNILAFTATNNTAVPIAATITVTPGNSITGCTGPPAMFTITVNSAVAQSGISAGSASGFILSCAGTPSASPQIEQISVSGASLTGDVTAKAPAGFEISATPSGGYGNSLVLPQSAGTLKSTIVYVRSAASATAGPISGNITFSSPGTPDQTVAVTGLINAIITAGPIANQTIKAGTSTTGVNFTNTGNVTYSWTNNTPGVGLSASGTGNIPAFTAINTGTTPVTATITVTPLPTSLAYVPDYNSNVNIVNILTGQVVGTVPVDNSPISVAVSPDGSRVYICNSNANDISVIDASTKQVTATIQTSPSRGPYYIALSPDGSKLYAACSATNTVIVINTATNAIISTVNINTGGAPQCITVSPDGQKLYISNFIGETISVVSTVTDAVLSTIQLTAIPYATAISPDGSRLYVAIYGSSGFVLVVDTATGNVIATIPVAPSSQSIAITPDGSKVYVTNTDPNTVTVISTATNSIINTISVGSGPFGVAVSPDGSLVCVTSAGSNSVSIISAATDKVIRTVNAPSPLALGGFISGDSGCIGPPATFTITVDPILPPAFSASASLKGLTTTYGTPSASESFTISGSNMNAGALVTPPAGFEVSTDNISFSATVTAGNAGTISSIPVYIRLAATTPAGTSYNGNIVLTSQGAPDVKISMPNSVVNKAPLTVTADNKTKPQGAPNPELTVTYTGFVNGDGPAQLTTAPTVTTNANASSAVGEYTIMVSGGESSNYTFSYVSGTLTVTPSLQYVTIPNAFTPNGDGINDYWNIPQLAYYPNCLVSIFTRYGSLVFQSRGYAKPWDGTRNGAQLPVGTYYYVIDLRQNGIGLLSGFVAVLR